MGVLLKVGFGFGFVPLFSARGEATSFQEIDE
jgi:hypothetical protein